MGSVRRAMLTVGALLAATVNVPASAGEPCTTTSPCDGLRPGAAIAVAGTECSAGFLLRDAQRRRYLSTAGHCVRVPSIHTTREGDRLWPTGRGPSVTGPDGNAVGRVVFATLTDASDFALVELFGAAAASAEPVTGGQLRRVRSEVRVGDRLRVVGQGIGVSLVAQGRDGLVSGVTDPTQFKMVIPAAPGDSGGPVFSDSGDAAGLLIQGGGFVFPDPGIVNVIRLTSMLARAESGLGRRLTLLATPR